MTIYLLDERDDDSAMKGQFMMIKTMRGRRWKRWSFVPIWAGSFKFIPGSKKGLCDMKFSPLCSLFAATFAAAKFTILGSCMKLAVESDDFDVVESLIYLRFHVDSPMSPVKVSLPWCFLLNLGRLTWSNISPVLVPLFESRRQFGYTTLHFACNRDGSTEGLIACLNIGGAELNAKETEQAILLLHFAAANGSFWKGQSFSRSWCY